MAMAEERSFESAPRDVLLSAAKLIGASCVDVHLAFTRCKAANSNPEACLKLGAAVLACNKDVLRKIDQKCPESFETFRKCMDKTQMKYPLCRKEEVVFHDCFYAEP